MNIRDKLMSARTWAASHTADALLAGGAVSIAAGAGMVYQPAGYIVGGLLAMAGGWILAGGGQ